MKELEYVNIIFAKHVVWNVEVNLFARMVDKKHNAESVVGVRIVIMDVFAPHVSNVPPPPPVSTVNLSTSAIPVTSPTVSPATVFFTQTKRFHDDFA